MEEFKLTVRTNKSVKPIISLLKTILYLAYIQKHNPEAVDYVDRDPLPTPEYYGEKWEFFKIFATLAQRTKNITLFQKWDIFLVIF